MLKSLRNKKFQKRMFIGLAVVIIPPFVLWGTMFSNKSDKGGDLSALGRLHGRKISAQDYLASYRSVEHEMRIRFGQNYRQMRERVNMKAETWDRILLMDYARRQKLKASDRDVVAWIESQPAFAGKAGFDEHFYKMYVSEYLRMDARAFEEEVRGLLTIDKIRASLAGKVSLSDAELESLYAAENSERDIAYAVVPWESEKDKVLVKDEDLLKVFEIVKGQLTEGDRALTQDQTKAKVRALVVENDATRLAVARLQALRERMNDPGDFEKVLNQEKIEVRRFEKFKRDSHVEGLGSAEQLFKSLAPLKVGEISKALPVSSGAALIKVLSSKAPDAKTFDADKEKFRTEMIAQKTAEEMRALLENLRKQLQINTEVMKELA